MAASILSRVGLGLLVASSGALAKNTAGAPYQGVAATVPGVIEAEYFDYGGEGVGYSDSTSSNIPKDYRRDEAVDVQGWWFKDGYHIAYFTLGEYLRYTVNVTEDVERFYFDFVVSSAKSTGSFHIVSGGTGCDDFTNDLTGPVVVPKTGGWDSYVNLPVTGKANGGLKAGETYIWLCLLTETFNIDYFTIKASDAQSGPFLGRAATIPGVIEAEEFDLGGEGVGYSDTSPNNFPGAFRKDVAVDIHALPFSYDVTYIDTTEYLRYTVDVTKNFDSFNFKFLVASYSKDGSFRIVSGGTGCNDFTTNLSGVVMVPKTGGWEKYETLTVSGPGNGGLVAGTTQIWLCPLSKAFNIDSFTVEGVSLSAAFGGTSPTIPGQIEAEEFDVGGPGVAYYDKTPTNTGSAFRSDEGVDIGALKGGGYKVNTITKGEYLRYSVDVAKNVDAFFFSFVLSSNKKTASFRIVSGGTGCDDFDTDLSGKVNVPYTGGLSKLETVLVSGEGNGGLDAGPAMIWLCALSSGFTIDSFTMASSEAMSTPYTGTPVSIPGLIEAELFDKGGQELAYYDGTSTNKGKVFRTSESVDIGSIGSDFYVGWITEGEYLQYSVDVKKNYKSFDFSFRVAAPKKSSGLFLIVAGGTGCDDFTLDLSGLVSVSGSGWSKYKNVKISSAGTGGLPAGEAIIRLCVVDGDFNIDSFSILDTSS